jgi:hypothetical protein
LLPTAVDLWVRSFVGSVGRESLNYFLDVLLRFDQLELWWCDDEVECTFLIPFVMQTMDHYEERGIWVSH